jgi:hypothetical protein
LGSDFLLLSKGVRNQGHCKGVPSKGEKEMASLLLIFAFATQLGSAFAPVRTSPEPTKKQAPNNPSVSQSYRPYILIRR